MYDMKGGMPTQRIGSASLQVVFHTINTKYGGEENAF
jgi:hypothetical protein